MLLLKKIKTTLKKTEESIAINSTHQYQTNLKLILLYILLVSPYA